jgi:hypothetical protein
MIQTIAGKVSRVIDATGNFFIYPDDPSAVGFMDVDGHRVGDGEISAHLINAQRPKIRQYAGAAPAVGDPVTLELIVEVPDPPPPTTRR